jgi:hypothetical protein
MKRLLCVAGLMALALSLGGCATPTKMPFAKSAEKGTAGGGPILLLTATIKNTHHPTFQPELLVVHVETPDAKAKAQRFNFVKDDYADLVPPKVQAKKNKKAKAESGDPASTEGHTYLIRLQLPPGDYVIRGLTSMSQSFPIIANFFAPMHSPLKVSEGGVIYLGHVDATVRERQGEEFRAGPVIPLIDQAAAGASGGTFDVVISDQLETDEKIFRERFTQLANVEILKSILPPFDRDAAQKWWKEH